MKKAKSIEELKNQFTEIKNQAEQVINITEAENYLKGIQLVIAQKMVKNIGYYTMIINGKKTFIQ